MKNNIRISFIGFLFLLLSFIPRVQYAQSSLYMPAATNWVSVGDLDVAGSQLTVEALIYYTGASVDIVSKHTDPGNVNYLLRIGSFEITTTSGFAAFSGAAAAGVSIVPNKMYHVAATYDGAMLRYYVNGCMTGSMAWTGDIIQSNLITAIGNMSTCQCEQFVGYIDEVRIWNVARTQAEISANMLNLPSPTTQPGLLGYWKFDGNYTNMQGNTAFDGIAQGAPQFQSIPLPYPTALHESVTSSDPVCQGDANGYINISASGYYSPYEYSLDGITYSTTPVFPNLIAGNYTVYTRPQNNSGCAVSTLITINDPPVLQPNLSFTDVTCFGAADGTASAAPSGGDGPVYHQLWQPGLQTSASITGLAPGNYSVTISDTCRAAGTELLTNGHFEDGNVGFTSGYSCCTGGPGGYSVDADPSYYNAGHSGVGYGGGGNYLIADGHLTPNTSLWCQTVNVIPNTYYSLSAFVASNYSTSLAIVEFNINGSSVGTLNAPGATGVWLPFQAAWFSGASTTASICIIDQNTIGGGNDFGIDNISFKTCQSCINTTPFIINEPPALTTSISGQINVTCNGGNNGSATVNATGGTPGYSYSWNTVPVQTTATASNLTAGTYTVTVTDLNLCSSSQTVTITEPPLLTVSLSSQTNILCNGGTDGNADITVSGGTPGYSYSWNTSPIQTTTTASNLAAGTYTVTVTDLSLCSTTQTVVITEPLVLTVSLSSQTNVFCNGGTNGSATVAANNGTPGYSYSWNTSPVQITATAINLTAGTYTATVTDLNSCTSSQTVTITESSTLIASLSSQTNVTCNGGTNGSATVNVSGGAPGYSYSWNTLPVQTTATASNLSAGTYTVTVTDLNLCSDTATATITEPPLLTVSLSSQTNILCNGGADGNADIAVSGGTPGYSYSWNTSPIQTTAAANNLPAGTYTVTVTDLDLCSDSQIVIITEPTVLTATLSTQTNVSCNGGSNGSATASAAGGTPGYSYSWNTTPAQTTATAINLGAGTYTATVTDSNSCSATVIVTITEPPVLTLSLSSQTNVSCNGGNNGSATVSANGGAPGYSYSWNTSPVQTSATAINLTAGTYTAIVTDTNSCTANVVANITEPLVLDIMMNSKTDPSCFGSSDGNIYVSASGGTISYAYSWSPNVSTADSALNLSAGTYNITVTDGNGCTKTIPITLTDPLLLTMNAGATLPTICRGLTTTINATAAGGTVPYSYLWNNLSTLNSQSVQPLTTTTYTVVVTDSKNCTAIDSIQVTVNQPIAVYLGNDTAICNGYNVLLDAGTGYLSYQWQDGSVTQTHNVITTGIYRVTAVDINGCIVKDTIQVTVNPLPIPGLMDTVKICPGTDTILNANPGYTSYLWNTAEITSSILVNTSGKYKVIIQDLNGCVNTDSTWLYIHPVPSLSFIIGPLSGCSPVDLTIQNTSTLNGSIITNWDWQIGSTAYNEFAPDPVLSDSGYYNVFLQATTTNNCIVDSMTINYIDVYAMPIPVITAPVTSYELLDDELFLYNQSTIATSYEWSLAGQFISESYDLVYPVTDTGHFVFQLMAMNNDGCKDSTEILITVNPSFAIYFPNAFTPNENGNNDTYAPKGYGIHEFEIFIYDRWGNLVFTSNNIDKGWDGTFKGQPAMKDVYVYKCRMKDIKRDKHYYTGAITLIR